LPAALDIAALLARARSTKEPGTTKPKPTNQFEVRSSPPLENRGVVWWLLQVPEAAAGWHAFAHRAPLAAARASPAPSPRNSPKVLDADWEAGLGSNALDMLLADHFAAQFSEKTGLGDVRWASLAARARACVCVCVCVCVYVCVCVCGAKRGAAAAAPARRRVAVAACTLAPAGTAGAACSC
jgi:hypothetical protein